MGWLWIELRPLLWEASSEPPEAWDDSEIHVKVTFTPFFFSSWSQYCSFILKIVVLVHVIIWDSMVVSYCPLISRNSLGKFLNQSELVFSVSKGFCQIILLFCISLQSKCQLFTTVIWNREHCSVDALIILPELSVDTRHSAVFNPLRSIAMFPMAADCFAHSSMAKDLQSERLHLSTTFVTFCPHLVLVFDKKAADIKYR